MAQRFAIPVDLTAHAERWLGGGAWAGDLDAVAHRPWVAICGSRMGRQLHRLPHAFSLLRATLLRCRRTGGQVVWCAGSAVDECVSRAVRLLQVPGARLDVCDWGDGHAGATGRRPGHSPASPDGHTPTIRTVAIGPASRPPRHSQCPLSDFPRRDCAAVGLADEVVVLHLRSNGAIAALIGARLQESPARAASVRVPASLAPGQALMQQGAVGWHVLDGCSHPEAHDSPPQRQPTRDAAVLHFQQLSSSRAADEPDGWPYVVHCTRAADGSTPGFSHDAQLDQLILGEPIGGGSALTNLIQILRSGRLCGTRRLTRSDQPVVCFSAVPLARLLARRRFRPHLGRWDYEPYGIGVRKDRLRQLGGRPVTYVDPDQLPKTKCSDPFFLQPRGRSYDWTEEREWRIAYDLDIGSLTPADAFVFVASEDDVPHVAPWTDLTIVVCSSHPGQRQ